MTFLRFVAISAIAFLATQPPTASAAAAAASDANKTPLTSVATLEEQAKLSSNAKPRVVLPEESSAIFQGIDSLETSGSGQVPNYLRALSPMPNAVKAFAHLTRTILLGGAVEPEVKMAMGLRMAQMHDSPYVAAHMERFLRSTEHGQTLLAAIKSGKLDSLTTSDRLALTYAEELTQGVHGVSDSEFARVSGYFNDSQLV